jgi:DNA-binding transcriptional LysR family regulator
MTLTDAGKSYVAACKRILEEVTEAERIATWEYTAPKGELNITAPMVFGRLHLVPVLSDFLRAYPDIVPPACIILTWRS